MFFTDVRKRKMVMEEEEKEVYMSSPEKGEETFRSEELVSYSDVDSEEEGAGGKARKADRFEQGIEK